MLDIKKQSALSTWERGPTYLLDVGLQKGPLDIREEPEAATCRLHQDGPVLWVLRVVEDGVGHPGIHSEPKVLVPSQAACVRLAEHRLRIVALRIQAPRG
eukprot:9480635-Pyramimonas_sp.AAC.2